MSDWYLTWGEIVAACKADKPITLTPKRRQAIKQMSEYAEKMARCISTARRVLQTGEIEGALS